MIGVRFWLAAVAIVALCSMGCVPGYIKADELERKQQGPSQCATRCQELGMRMGALVLVGDELPGCVCQPLAAPPAFPAVPAPSAAPPAPAPSAAPAAALTPDGDQVSSDAASGATTGYTVALIAAAAARQQQLAQQRQQSFH